MIRRISAVLIIVLLASLAIVKFTQSSSSVEPLQLLRRAYSEGRSISYIGRTSTSVFYCGHEYNTSSLVQHKNTRERIDYKNGVTVISLPGEVRTYRPDKKQVLISCPQRKNTAHNTLDLLLRNYTPVSAGVELVAHRRAEVIDLTPKHKGNPSKRLWIDRSTGIILRMEDRTSTGEIRSRTEFARISYGDNLTDNTFKMPDCVNSSWTTVRAESSGSSRDVGKKAGIPVALPKYLPVGYVLDGIGIYDCGCACGHKAAHIRYTNGLNSISVYETPVDMKCGDRCKIHCPSGGRCRVSDTSQARVAMASSRGRSTVVVADLPSKEIAKIAESVK